MASLPEQCCTLPPFASDYVPIGDRVTIKVEGQDDMELYLTGPAGAKTAVVGIYDVCGMHQNTLQGADHLAATAGFRVVVPDFFRGGGWPTDNFPPREGRPAMNAWVQSVGAWEVMRPGLLATVDYLTTNGATSLGAYGLCFGAKKLVEGAHLNLFNAIALVHPSLLTADGVKNVNVPVALVPSQGENQEVMNAFWDAIQAKPDIAAKSVREDFLDMHHGFASARSNWGDERLAARARDAYSLVQKFFSSTL